jgi:hypothetical protein
MLKWRRLSALPLEYKKIDILNLHPLVTEIQIIRLMSQYLLETFAV